MSIKKYEILQKIHEKGIVAIVRAKDAETGSKLADAI